MITDNEILDFYAWGWELSSSDAPFPNDFKTYSEKLSCLVGYTNFDTGVALSNEEIIKEVRSKI